MNPRTVVMVVAIAACASVALPASAGSERPATSAAEESAIRIGPEDVLEILVRGEPGLSRTVTVRPDGMITLPLVNDIDVRGLSVEEVRSTVTERLKEFVRTPSVTVIVEQLNSFKVFFLGEVNTQGPINLHRPTRLLQAVAAAGGVTEFAKKEVVLIRETDQGQTRIEIDLKELMRGKNVSQNIFLKSGDTILVN